MNRFIRRKLSAFTLIEVLLAVALLSAISILLLPVGQEYLNKSEMDNATTIITQTIRSAQANAKSGKADSEWGIRIVDSSIVLFQGASYASRNLDADLTNSWSDRFSVSGINEIVFSRIDGNPSTTGTISLNGFDLSVNITINSKGNLLY